MPAGTRSHAPRGAAAIATIGARLDWRVFLPLAVLIVVARRPRAILAPTFWNEDGPVFYTGALRGDPPWTTYQGYIHVIPRLVADVETLVPWPALLGNLVALAVMVGVAGFVASDRMSRLLPDRRTRFAAAAVVLLLPAAYEVWASLTYVQWWLGLYLVLGLAAWPATGRSRWADRAVLALASVTGPFAIFVAPLYWLRRDLRTSALILSVGAAVQLIALAGSARSGMIRIPDDVLGIVARRVILEPMFGAYWVPLVPTVVAAALVIPIALCLRRMPLSVLAVAAALLAAGLAFSIDTTAQLLGPAQAQRYFFIPGAVIAIAIVSAASRRERAGLIVAFLACGIIGDFPLWSVA